MTAAAFDVRPATPADAAAVAAIYNHYVVHTVVTFEEEPVEAAEMAQRMAAVESDGLPWLVAELGGGVAGYAYAGKWKPRSGYRFAVEVTVYVAPGHERLGIGSRPTASSSRGSKRRACTR